METQVQNSFSRSRLTMLIKRQWISNRSNLSLQMMVLAGLILVAEAFITFAFYDSWQTNDYYYVNGSARNDNSGNAAAVCWVIGLYLFSGLAASFSFSPLSTKPGRVNTLMLPGTQLEKFLSRVLIYTVGFLLFYLAASIVADLLRCFYVMAFTPVTPRTFLQGIFSEDEPLLYYTAFAGLFFEISFYVMLSVFAPRLTFIKGICVSIGASFALGFVNLIIAPLVLDHISSDYAEQMIFCFSSLGIIVSCVMLWIAYFRYKETDIQ